MSISNINGIDSNYYKKKKKKASCDHDVRRVSFIRIDSFFGAKMDLVQFEKKKPLWYATYVNRDSSSNGIQFELLISLRFHCIQHGEREAQKLKAIKMEISLRHIELRYLYKNFLLFFPFHNASTLCLTVNRVIYRSVAMQWIYHFHYVLYKHFQACAFLANILLLLLLSLILWMEYFGCHTVGDYQNCIQKVSHTQAYLNVRFENSIMPHKNAKSNNVCDARVNG